MVQSGVNAVAGGMMVGRPGNQQGGGGQGPMGNPQSKLIKIYKFSFQIFFFFIIIYVWYWFYLFFNILVGQMGKAPSAIKTNIKAASQIHPYGR